MNAPTPLVQPDLSERPLETRAEGSVVAPTDEVYAAWTTPAIARWFAAPGTVSMRAEVGAPWFFETRFDGERHPHYGRFLALEADRRIVTTWTTAAGTAGVETVLEVVLAPEAGGTRVGIHHRGFPDERSRNGHAEAWPGVLEELRRQLEGGAPAERAAEWIASDVYPSLTYADAPAAIEWLCRAFGFEAKLVVPGEDGTVRHSELRLGTGVVMVSSPKPEAKRVSPREQGAVTSALSVYVTDPDAHHARARLAGAEIVGELEDEHYGARGYMARDPEGYHWYFANYRPGKWWGPEDEAQ